MHGSSFPALDLAAQSSHAPSSGKLLDAKTRWILFPARHHPILKLNPTILVIPKFASKQFPVFWKKLFPETSMLDIDLYTPFLHTPLNTLSFFENPYVNAASVLNLPPHLPSFSYPTLRRFPCRPAPAPQASSAASTENISPTPTENLASPPPRMSL